MTKFFVEAKVAIALAVPVENLKLIRRKLS